MADTLRDISQKYCRTQPHQIDNVLQATPFLARVPFEESTHGLWHNFEKVTDIDAAAFVPIDGKLPEAGVDTEIDIKTLGILGFKMTIGIDKLGQLYGKGRKAFTKYLAARAPKVMGKSGMNLEQGIAKIFKAYAKRNGKLFSAGGTGNNVETVFAIRLVKGECSGLIDPAGFGNGAFFDTILLSNGEPYDKEGKTVYGADFKTYLDFLCENPDCVAAYTNITDASPLTSDMVDKLLLEVRAGDIGETFIVGNPKAIRYVNRLKNALTTKDENASRKFKEWDDIEILSSWNFPSEEAAMTDLTDDGLGKLSLSGEDLKVDGESFFDKESLTNGENLSKAIKLGKGGQAGSILIKGVADEALTMPSDGSIAILHSKSENGTYEELFSTTLSKSVAKGKQMLEFILPPSFLGWAKIKVTAPTGESVAAPTGRISVYPAYLPR